MLTDDTEVMDVVLKRFNAHINYIFPKIYDKKIKNAFIKYANHLVDFIEDPQWNPHFNTKTRHEEVASKMVLDVYQEIYETTTLRFRGNSLGRLMEIQRA